ncbi:hypothetical protein GEMRC1_001091 [Eukaryota sp. GEM-RC1]
MHPRKLAFLAPTFRAAAEETTTLVPDTDLELSAKKEDVRGLGWQKGNSFSKTILKKWLGEQNYLSIKIFIKVDRHAYQAFLKATQEKERRCISIEDL